MGVLVDSEQDVCTVRSGPTVKLLLRNRRVVTLTVPDPAAAVAALNAASGGRAG